MGMDKPDIADSLPSEDNGSIEQALSQADEKLAAWTAAMIEAQARLTPMGPVSDVPCAPADEALPEETQAPPSNPETVNDIDPSPGMVSEPEPERELPDNDACPAADEQPESAADGDDDEALLASLDTDTANAIRVMRRLSPGQESVRELLKRHQKTKSTRKSSPEKRTSWFSRKG